MTPAGPAVEHTMADETAVQNSGPGWAMFQWIVGGLVAAIAVLVGVIYNDMRSSIRETAEGLSTFKIEVARQFGDVARQFGDVARQLDDLKSELAAVNAGVTKTNAKFDKLIDRLDRPRTR